MLEQTPTDLARTVQEMVDREAIKELKARYCRLLDTKDYDGFRKVFTDDAHFGRVAGVPVDFGIDTFMEKVQEMADGLVSVHHAHLPELWFDSPTEAHGTWAVADSGEWAPDPETGDRQGVKGYGRYDETYRKVDGQWKIASLNLSYLRREPLPREPLADEVVRGTETLEKA